MRCAPKPVCPSQDRLARMAVFRWLISVQDYPWASAWLISPDHTWVSALQPVTTHSSSTSWKETGNSLFFFFFFSPTPISLEDKTKKRTIYNNEPPWFSIWSLANHISVDSWSHSLTHSLERLDSCVLPTLGCWVSAVTCLPTEWIMWPSASHGWSCTVSR